MSKQTMPQKIIRRSKAYALIWIMMSGGVSYIVFELHNDTKYSSLGYSGVNKSILSGYGLSRLSITVNALDTPASQILSEIRQRTDKHQCI